MKGNELAKEREQVKDDVQKEKAQPQEQPKEKEQPEKGLGDTASSPKEGIEGRKRERASTVAPYPPPPGGWKRDSRDRSTTNSIPVLGIGRAATVQVCLSLSCCLVY